MIARTLYSLLLLLYPEPMRSDARPEMLQLFTELHADARRRGRLAALRLTARACAEVLPRALDARRAPWERGRGRQARHTARIPPNPAGRALPRARARQGSPKLMLDRIVHDLRYSVRTLVRSPGYAAVIVLTLAVGIGANTAIFSVIKGVLLDALPYAEPERVVGIWQYDLESGDRARMTPGNFADVRALSDVFEHAAAFGADSATLIGDQEPEALRGGRVTAGYLDVLGVQPLLGRGFRPDEEDPGAPQVTIISEELWARRFASDPGILGHAVNFDGTMFEIVGVLPRGVYPTSARVGGIVSFTPDNHDFLVPLRYPEGVYQNRRSHVLGAIGRLAEGVSVQQADEAVDALAASIRSEYPIVAGEGFEAALLRDEIVGGSRSALLVLMGTVAVVLLIAATNVAGLMLARADARGTEIGVRAALGAGRWQLVRESLTEALLLTAVGCLAGVALAGFGVDAIKRMVPFQIPRMDQVALDGATLAFALAVALLVATVLGIAPSLLATRSDLLSRLRQGATSVTADGRQRRAHRALVAAQACMAVMLVVGAGLLARTFLEIRRIDPGFSRGAALALPLSLPSTRYPSPEDTLRFFDELERSLTAMPGVAAVAYGYDHPLSKNWGDGFLIEGRPPLPPEQSLGATFRPVTPGYFETVGIALMRGRTFVATDDADHPYVVVVNEAFAAGNFPDQTAVGKRIRIPTVERMFGDGSEQWMEIVGVVADVRFNGPTVPVEPAMYVSLRQVPLSNFVVLVTPERAGVDLLGTTRRAIHALDADLPVTDVRTLDALLAEAVARERFNMILVGLFAALALALAGLGIYGLIARLVQRQIKEIGIRVALGAQRGQILHLVLAGALAPVVIGGMLGIAGAAALSRLLESLLYEVGPLDPVTFVATPLVLLAIALVAGWLPARRATRIDPILALRDE